MSANRIYLLVDDSEASLEAKQKLMGLGLNIELISASGPNVPSAKVGNTSYSGRWGIDFLVSGLRTAGFLAPTLAGDNS